MMKFYRNKTLCPVSSVEELKSLLEEPHESGVRFNLVDEESGLSLYAVCLGGDDSAKIYSLSYIKTGTHTEFFTKSGDEAPGIQWVMRYFESFYLKNGQWRDYSEWSETYSVKGLVVFFVMILLIGGLIMAGKYFSF